MSVKNTYYKFESCCSDEVLYFQGPLYALDYFYTLTLTYLNMIVPERNFHYL